MVYATQPENEADRIADLRALRILDTPPEARFDRIVRLARMTFGVEIAYIAMVDSNRQWFKSKCGLTIDESGRETSFCGHTIMQDGPLIIPDARLDERFHDNPLVTGEPFIRFYAGYPLKGPKGHNVATFCIASSRPRTLSDDELAIFAEMAASAEHELNMVDVIRAQRDLIETKSALVEARAQLALELSEAADYVRSLLPAPLKGPLVRTDWRHVASTALGGDVFGHHWLDDDRLALYLVDACGHGVAAALLSISVYNSIRRAAVPGAAWDDPASVLAALNRAYPMREHGEKFFTIWYAVYDAPRRSLRFGAAGHPPAMLVPKRGETTLLGGPNFMIGVVDDASFDVGERSISPGSRLLVYSDGVTDVAVRAPGAERLLQTDGLQSLLEMAQKKEGSRVARVLAELEELHGSSDFSDDVSMLEVEFL